MKNRGQLKFRLSEHSVVVSIILLQLLWPDGLSVLFPMLDQIQNILEISAFAFIFILYICDNKISLIMILIIAYEAIQLISTIANGGDFRRLAIDCGENIAICMLIEYMARHNADSLLKGMMYLLSAECLINLCTILIFPDGMYIDNNFWQNWLLGYDNKHFMYILPLLCVFIIYADSRGFPFLLKLAGVLLFSSSIYITWSAASIVAVTAWIALWLLAELTKCYKFLTLFRVIATHAAFFFAIVVAHIDRWFDWLIVDILNKPNSISSRAIHWDMAKELIAEKPLLGWGVAETELTRSRLGGFSHCHNQILQILYQSGVVGIISFLGILIALHKPLSKAANKKYVFLYLNTLLCFFIVGQVEAIRCTTTLFAIIMLAYHAPRIERIMAKKKASDIHFTLHRL